MDCYIITWISLIKIQKKSLSFMSIIMVSDSWEWVVHLICCMDPPPNWLDGAIAWFFGCMLVLNSSISMWDDVKLFVNLINVIKIMINYKFYLDHKQFNFVCVLFVLCNNKYQCLREGYHILGIKWRFHLHILQIYQCY